MITLRCSRSRRLQCPNRPTWVRLDAGVEGPGFVRLRCRRHIASAQAFILLSRLTVILPSCGFQRGIVLHGKFIPINLRCEILSQRESVEVAKDRFLRLKMVDELP